MTATLLVNGWFWGEAHTGSGQYLHGLLGHLAAALPGWQVTVLVQQAADSRQQVAGSAGAVAEPLPATCHLPPTTFQPATTPSWARGSRLIKLAWEQVTFPAWCRRLGADAAFVPYWGSPIWPPCPTLVTIHDLIPLLLAGYATKPTARAYTRLVAASARRAAAVLTVSQAARADILAHLGLPPERVVVTYEGLGAPHAPVTDPQERERVRRAYDLPPAYLFYLGGFDPRKNVPLLLAAYGRALSQRPDLPPLLIAGRLPEPGAAWFTDPQPHIARLGLDGTVRLLGFVPDADKPALYTGASLFVFPSAYEGFGLPPLEAMACGTPALVSARSSLPEVVGDTLAPVAANDEAALAAGMLAALDHPPARERLLAQAARFRWEDTAALTAQAVLAARRS